MTPKGVKMKIVTLVENTSTSPEYKHKHGLSFYIETSNHKILFDLGPNDLFLENAKKMDIDIKSVDTVIISHGHSDHGGGLATFLQENQLAKVYIRRNAFNLYFNKVLGISFNIGLDPSLINNTRIVLTDESLTINGELELFSDVKEREYYSTANNALLKKIDKEYMLDDFSHEQNLIIHEEDKYVLFAGCAHNGIVNILKKGEQLVNGNLNFIISGFHLFNPSTKKYESEQLIRDIGLQLKLHNTKYFTCHCTGEKAFNILKDVLKDQIDYLAIGSSINL